MSSTTTLYIHNDDNKLVLTFDDAAERFDQMIDECYPTVTILGLDYDPSRVLRETDPIAYRCELVNFLDADFTEVEVPTEAWLDDDAETIERCVALALA